MGRAARRFALAVCLLHVEFQAVNATGGETTTSTDHPSHRRRDSRRLTNSTEHPSPDDHGLSAESHGAEDHHRWWCSNGHCYEHERAYVETCVVIILLIGALVFEHFFHVAQHVAENSYDYGKLQDRQQLLPMHMPHSKSHNRPATAPLFKLLVTRISGEFMVLGWLAFIIFVFRAAEGFEAVSAAFPVSNGEGMHLPHTAEDWLHLIELVHMKLFMGMIMYFALITRIVWACVCRVSTWEEMRILKRKINDSAELTNTEFRKYGRWRAYFILNVVDWRLRRPKLFQEIAVRLCGPDGCKTEKDFQIALDTHFAFSAYLSYAVREAATDAIDIHQFTWFGIIALFFIFTLLHRFAHAQLNSGLLPIFICAAFLLLFALRGIIKRALLRVEADGSKLQLHYSRADLGSMSPINSPASSAAVFSIQTEATLPKAAPTSPWASLGSEQETFHERYNTEVWMLRTMQVILFVLSYSCAQTIGDPDGWRDHPHDVLILLLAFFALFALLAALLPGYIPDFAAVMALPPYVDSGNVEALFRVLDNFQPSTDANDSGTGISYQGSQPPKALLAHASALKASHPSAFNGSALGTIRGSVETSADGLDQEPGVEASCARIEAAISGLSERQEELTRRVDMLQASAMSRPSLHASAGGADELRLSVPDDVDERQDGVEGVVQQMEIIRRELRRMELLLPQVTRRSAFKVNSTGDDSLTRDVCLT